MSHSSADKPRVTPLVNALANKKIPIWFDKNEIGVAAAIPRKMSEGLESSTFLLVAWSSNAKQSPHVLNEIDAFYMRHPQPGTILFLSLDSVPVPALYAARLYLRASDTAADAETIAKWASGESVPRVEVADAETLTGLSVESFPRGPLVPRYWVGESLIDTYAELFATSASATRILNRAIQLRLAADPTNKRFVRASDLPVFGNVGPTDYWMAVFDEACKQGPRMLAALLLAEPDDRYSEDVRRERAAILLKLRNHQ